MSASPVWEQGGAPAARRRKTGTLLKWVNYVSGWQKRYFELQNGLLSYYRSADEVGAGCRGSMLAREIAIDHRGREMILSAGNATFYLRATSEKELMRWITALELEKQQIPVDGGPHIHIVDTVRQAGWRCESRLRLVVAGLGGDDQKEVAATAPRLLREHLIWIDGINLL